MPPPIDGDNRRGPAKRTCLSRLPIEALRNADTNFLDRFQPCLGIFQFTIEDPDDFRADVAVHDGCRSESSRALGQTEKRYVSPRVPSSTGPITLRLRRCWALHAWGANDPRSRRSNRAHW